MESDEPTIAKDTELDEIWTLAHLAQRYGLSPSTLSKRSSEQLPPRLKMPGSRLWRYRSRDVLEWEAGLVQRPDLPPPDTTHAVSSGIGGRLGKRKRGRPKKLKLQEHTDHFSTAQETDGIDSRLGKRKRGRPKKRKLHEHMDYLGKAEEADRF